MDKGADAITPGNDPAADWVGARLRSLRANRGLTLERLAEATGLTRGYLSLLERGLKTPSLAALVRIADALGSEIGHLFGEEVAHQPDYVLYRHAERPAKSNSRQSRTVPLAPMRSGKIMEPFFILPGFEATDRMTHSGDELIVVLSGEVLVRLSDEEVILNVNDSLYFAASVDHQLQSIGEIQAQVLVVVGRRTMARSDPPITPPAPE